MAKFLKWLAVACMMMAGSAAALAQTAPGDGYGPHMWYGGWHAWFFGPLMMVVFIGVAALVVVLLVRWLGGGHPGAPYRPPGPTPLDILKERFARGEIDKEEFEERRRLLRE